MSPAPSVNSTFTEFPEGTEESSPQVLSPPVIQVEAESDAEVAQVQVPAQVIRSAAAPLPCGRGKGKGLGKYQGRRRRRILRDNLQRITSADLRRLARRGGVKRMSKLVCEEARTALRWFLEEIIRETVELGSLRTHKNSNFTVTTADVLYTLRRQNRTLYGADAFASR